MKYICIIWYNANDIDTDFIDSYFLPSTYYLTFLKYINKEYSFKVLKVCLSVCFFFL